MSAYQRCLFSEVSCVAGNQYPLGDMTLSLFAGQAIDVTTPRTQVTALKY